MFVGNSKPIESVIFFITLFEMTDAVLSNIIKYGRLDQNKQKKMTSLPL